MSLLISKDDLKLRLQVVKNGSELSLQSQFGGIWFVFRELIQRLYDLFGNGTGNQNLRKFMCL